MQELGSRRDRRKPSPPSATTARDLERRPGVVKDVLANGKDRATKRANQTLDEAKHAMGIA